MNKRFKKGLKHILYLSLFILIGLIQLIDYKIFHHNPNWHVIFYVVIIPLINIIYGFVFAKEDLSYVYPTVAAMLSISTFVIFGNGGMIERNLKFSVINVFTVTVPSFLSPIIGLLLAKSKKINKKLDKIKQKIAFIYYKDKIEVIEPDKNAYKNRSGNIEDIDL